MAQADPERYPEERLSGLLRALWHAVVRATRAAEHLPSLPESHVAVLRTLVAAEELTPAQLAAQLRLARSTVSNLIRELTVEGLVERRPSAADGRSVLLVATDRAREVLEAFGRGRVEVVARALDDLSEADRQDVVSVLPALERLLERLQTTVAVRPESD
jgi:DNA-binding MarR family transcriptional regulator